jgi:uncharacterized protein YbcV (DUF1398 family)
MFTADQIKAEHAKVKSGADFPRYVQTLISLGVSHYTFQVADGSCTFHGHNGYEAKWPPKYDELSIAPTAKAEMLSNSIAIHQQGKTDFLTFCRQAAEAGVAQWTTDLKAMQVIYKGANKTTILAEPIPTGEYA